MFCVSQISTDSLPDILQFVLRFPGSDSILSATHHHGDHQSLTSTSPFFFSRLRAHGLGLVVRYHTFSPFFIVWNLCHCTSRTCCFCLNSTCVLLDLLPEHLRCLPPVTTSSYCYLLRSPHFSALLDSLLQLGDSACRNYAHATMPFILSCYCHCYLQLNAYLALLLLPFLYLDNASATRFLIFYCHFLCTSLL